MNNDTIRSSSKQYKNRADDEYKSERKKTKLNNKGQLFSLLNEALKFINVRTIRLLPSLKNNHVESSRDKTRMVENLLCIGWWRQMTQATISRVL